MIEVKLYDENGKFKGCMYKIETTDFINNIAIKPNLSSSLLKELEKGMDRAGFKMEYDTKFYKSVPEVEEVIFNNPATIIKWTDGTKTVVKCHNDEFDEEVGFAMAVIKKLYGGRSGYQKIIKNAKRQEDKKMKEKLKIQHNNSISYKMLGEEFDRQMKEFFYSD